MNTAGSMDSLNDHVREDTSLSLDTGKNAGTPTKMQEEEDQTMSIETETTGVSVRGNGRIDLQVIPHGSRIVLGEDEMTETGLVRMIADGSMIATTLDQHMVIEMGIPTDTERGPDQTAEGIIDGGNTECLELIPGGMYCCEEDSERT